MSLITDGLDDTGRKAFIDAIDRKVREVEARLAAEVDATWWSGWLPAGLTSITRGTASPFRIDPVTRAVLGPSGVAVPPDAMRACEPGPGIASVALSSPRSTLDMSGWADEWDLLPDAP